MSRTSPSHFLLAATLSGAALCSSPTTSHAQNAPRFGVDGGLFFPSNSKTKNVFGSRFTSFGPGFGPTGVSRRKLYPDFDFMRQSRGDNRATVVIAGARFLAPVGKQLESVAGAGFAPYAGLGLNLIYADVNAPSAGVDETGFGAGASAIVGASFGGRFFTEGTYRLATSAANFNFSGAQVVVGVRF